MLSEQSKQGIAQAFDRAARSGLLRGAEDVIEIQPTDSCKLEDKTAARVLVITATSFAFRLMTVFHVQVTPASRVYFGGEDATDQHFNEALSEIVNMCGGALNRELSYHIPHLAMSIPYALSAECLKYLEQLKPQYLCSYAITINHAVQLQVALCMSCSAPIDIPVTAVAVEEKSGELELF